MESPCFLIDFDKNYNNDIDFYDKYNDDAFDLKLYSLLDINDAQPNQQRTDTFASMSLTASVDDGKVKYTSADGKFELWYSIVYDKVKSDMRITNWTSNYATGRLTLRTRIHKEDTASSHFINLPAYVDGIEQPLIVENETVGENQFFLQTLYIGSSFNEIIIDPLYQVDYSPSPATHLYYNYPDTTLDSGFTNNIDITVGLSDNNTVTKYPVQEKENGLTGSTAELVVYNKFDETTGTTAVDTMGNTNGTYFNTPTLTQSGISNTAVKYDGVNEYTRWSGTDFKVTSSQDFMVCFGYNSFGASDNDVGLFDFDNGNDGWGIYGHDNEIRMSVDTVSTGNKDFDTVTQFTDSNWHRVCYYIGRTAQRVYVDGSLEDTWTESLVGGIVTAPTYLYSGRNQAGDKWSDDAVDEFCFFKGTNIPYSSIASNYNLYGTCNEYAVDDTQGQVIVVRFSQTYDSDYRYFLNINKQTTGTHEYYIYAYDDSNTPSNQYLTHSLAGSGLFDINVSGLMDYMTNTRNLTYSKFRLYSDELTNVSEVFLRVEANDTEAPTITNCTVCDPDANPQSEYSCTESMVFNCEVTDNLNIDDVIFTINGTNYTASRCGIEGYEDRFKYEITPTQNTTLTQYVLETVYATDIVGLITTDSPNVVSNYSCIFEDYIDIQHNPVTDVIGISNVSATVQWTTNNPADSLVIYGLTPSNLSLTKYSTGLETIHSQWLKNLQPATTYYYEITSSVENITMTVGIYNFTTLSGLCVEDWVQDAISCLINDSYLISYTDQNACGTTLNLPVDNNTYSSCNYCTQDIEQVTSSCYQINSSLYQNVSYIDNNYYSCCVITSLPSDCGILSAPYNQTTIESCNISLENDFLIELDIDQEFGFGFGGINSDKVTGKIWINDTNTTYYCLSYVKTTLGQLLQTNPAYTERVEGGLLQLTPKEVESREFFVTKNGLSSVYWTDNNLIKDERDYIWGVECSGNNQLLKSELLGSAGYEGVNEPITRWVWAKENVFGIFTAGMIIMLLGIALFFIYRVIFR